MSMPGTAPARTAAPNASPDSNTNPRMPRAKPNPDRTQAGAVPVHAHVAAAARAEFAPSIPRQRTAVDDPFRRSLAVSVIDWRNSRRVHPSTLCPRSHQFCLIFACYRTPTAGRTRRGTSKLALRDQPGTAGSDARDLLSFAHGVGAAGEEDAEPVVIEVAEPST